MAVIATSLPILMAIWILVVASIVTSFHLYQTNKRLTALRKRVFELEMDRDAPGFRRDVGR